MAGETAVPGGWLPAVDVVETADALVVCAELPGVRREDIQLEVQGRELTLAGARPALEAGEAYLQLERSYGSFRRTFLLPDTVDPTGIDANLEDGVLVVRLAKRKDRSRRRVDIVTDGAPPTGPAEG